MSSLLVKYRGRHTPTDLVFLQLINNNLKQLTNNNLKTKSAVHQKHERLVHGNTELSLQLLPSPSFDGDLHVAERHRKDKPTSHACERNVIDLIVT
jgi:hypothetical protein